MISTNKYLCPRHGQLEISSIVVVAFISFDVERSDYEIVSPRS
jgi:hypothetical protein